MTEQRMTKDMAAELFVDLAEPGDVAAIAAIDSVAWSSGRGTDADEKEFLTRQANGGIFVTKTGEGRVVGYVSVFRPSWADPKALREIMTQCTDRIVGQTPEERWETLRNTYGLPLNWHEATGNGTPFTEKGLHNPGGKVIFGMAIITDPNYRGNRVVDETLSAALRASKQEGTEWFIAFSRLPSYRNFTQTNGETPVDRYLRAAVPSPEGMVPHDYGFRFHWRGGAQPVRTESGRIGYVGVRNVRYDDPESHNSGVFIMNPLEFGRFPFEKIVSQAGI
ncbi:MAG: hypothetical protein HY516_05100 [Candidatus Aenigmarchaeota archaeon]|nr:hypothetical protein [Candidatus Aenigmarchaeota archaeon]